LQERHYFNVDVRFLYLDLLYSIVLRLHHLLESIKNTIVQLRV